MAAVRYSFLYERRRGKAAGGFRVEREVGFLTGEGLEEQRPFFWCLMRAERGPGSASSACVGAKGSLGRRCCGNGRRFKRTDDCELGSSLASDSAMVRVVS